MTKTPTEITKLGEILMKADASIPDRANSMWQLRYIEDPLATKILTDFIVNIIPPMPASNALLQHEAAYCIGQKGSANSIEALESVIRNEKHEAIVRHEAGEALAAIACRSTENIPRIRSILKDFANVSIIELADTCQVGLGRLDWLESPAAKENNPTAKLSAERFPDTTDPSPSLSISSKEASSTENLKSLILSSTESVFSRYQAMFSLRNACVQNEKDEIKFKEVIDALICALSSSKSALLRHQIAFVLGQLHSERSINALLNCIQNSSENPIVRHEAILAIGKLLNVKSCDTEFATSARAILNSTMSDSSAVVRDSCALALNMGNYGVPLVSGN